MKQPMQPQCLYFNNKVYFLDNIIYSIYLGIQESFTDLLTLLMKRGSHQLYSHCLGCCQDLCPAYIFYSHALKWALVPQSSVPDSTQGCDLVTLDISLIRTKILVSLFIKTFSQCSQVRSHCNFSCVGSLISPPVTNEKCWKLQRNIVDF